MHECNTFMLYFAWSTDSWLVLIVRITSPETPTILQKKNRKRFTYRTKIEASLLKRWNVWISFATPQLHFCLTTFYFKVSLLSIFAKSWPLCRLRTGWSVKTQQLQGLNRSQEPALDEAEQAVILDVIRRAELLDRNEEERVGWAKTNHTCTFFLSPSHTAL